MNCIKLKKMKLSFKVKKKGIYYVRVKANRVIGEYIGAQGIAEDRILKYGFAFQGKKCLIKK